MTYFNNLMAMVRKPYYTLASIFSPAQDLSWIPSGGTIISTDNPAESPNGVRTSFTFTANPIFIVYNGQLLKNGVDFTMVGYVATLGIAPETGAELYAIV